jgi:sugar (pentulose or hexulose) kinase
MVANTTVNPWILDTAEVITAMQLVIDKIRWVGATTAGHQLILHDADGNVVYSAVATGANNTEESEALNAWTINGLTVNQIDSGIVYLTLR